MALIPVDSSHRPVDMQSSARVWEQDVAAAQRRMGNSVMAPFVCGSAINLMLAAEPRPVFCHSTLIEAADATGVDPLYVWTQPDDIYNARQQIVHIVAAPRTSGAAGSYSYAMRYGHTEYSRYATAIRTDTAKASVDQFEDVFEASWISERGARQRGNWNDGISTFNGYTILSVVVHDMPHCALNTDLHYYVNTPALHQGDSVLADIAEDVRAKQHELRQYSLPIVLSWSAQGITALPGAPGDKTGIVTASGTYVNAFDQSVTSRTATSPGVCVARQYAAVGCASYIPVVCRVYAEAATADCTVKFIGPDGVTTQTTEITIPADAGPHWYGTDDNIIQLNGAIAATDATANRNKIDVHVKAGTGGTLYLRAAVAWERFA